LEYYFQAENMASVLEIPTFILLFFTLYFEVFLVYTYLENKKSFDMTEAPERMPGKYPTVTIIVPAWNEELTLPGTVNSLLSLEYPKDKLTILIIDDGSTDRTFEVAQQYSANPQIRIMTKANGGKHTAMNLGIEESDSDLIGCLDADSYVEPNALREIVTYFDSKDVMAVTPSVQIYNPDNVLSKVQSDEYMIGEFTRKVFSRFNGLYVTPGPFSIYRRSVFAQIGGFVHGYGTEDMEMALRMQSNRMRIENAHTAIVLTVSPKTPLALYKQRVRWVSGFLKNAFFSYRHMFFNRKYENLGILTMPFAFISIFVALFFSAMYVKNLSHILYMKFLRWQALGFHFNFGMPNFDWFSLDIGFRRLIIYLMLGITILFVLQGGRMAKKKLHFSRNMLYFILLYGFIAPFWLIKSLYNLFTSKEAKWR